MTEERNMHHNQYDHIKPLHDKCKKYMHFHVILKLSDGSTVDGIIEDVTNDGVSVLVGEDGMQREEDSDVLSAGFFHLQR
ncbi:hypothetical protein [Metabacillus sp. Hm71]|uniref:hypothetical protein n=1 Tax=Metabacillus sp. Hm71 TaxID=3450743 RepID=UPI003F43B2FB